MFLLAVNDGCKGIERLRQENRPAFYLLRGVGGTTQLYSGGQPDHSLLTGQRPTQAVRPPRTNGGAAVLESAPAAARGGGVPFGPEERTAVRGISPAAAFTGAPVPVAALALVHSRSVWQLLSAGRGPAEARWPVPRCKHSRAGRVRRTAPGRARPQVLRPQVLRPQVLRL